MQTTGNIFDTRAIVSSAARLIYAMTISPFGYANANFSQNIRPNETVILLWPDFMKMPTANPSK